MKIKNSIKALMLLICMTALVIAGSGCDKEPQDAQPASPPKVDEPAVSSPDPVEETDDVPETTEPDTEEPPVVVSSQDGEIIPMVGVGPIKFGMSKDQVIAALGEPDVIEGGGIALFYPKSRGLSFMLDRTKGVREINCWSKNHPMPFPDGMTTYPGKTKEGIAMDATREEIIAAYGEPDRIVPRGPTEMLDYNELKAQFTIVDNKLVSLRLRGG
jgi:outer membrane protein assembly factor BamE (lipoprotein component of BamABCDE complex)